MHCSPKKEAKQNTTCQSVKITNSMHHHAVLIIVSNLQTQQWNIFCIMKYLFLSFMLASCSSFILFANSSSSISLNMSWVSFPAVEINSFLDPVKSYHPTANLFFFLLFVYFHWLFFLFLFLLISKSASQWSLVFEIGQN